MKNEIIKKNLIITILSLLIFFVLSIFATSYSIRNSFENENGLITKMKQEMGQNLTIVKFFIKSIKVG